MKGKNILMKKILAAVLAISMMFAIAACDSTPTDSTSTETKKTIAEKEEKEEKTEKATEATTKATTTAAPETTTETEEINDIEDIVDAEINLDSIPTTGSAAMDSFIKKVADGEFGFDFEMTTEEEGTEASATGSFAVKGEAMDMIIGMDMEGFSMEMHFLIKDGYTYLISDDTKSYIQMGEEIGMEMAPMTDSDFTGIVLKDTGEAEVNGEMLKYEEYDQDGETVRFYIKNGELYAFETPDGDNTVLIIFTSIEDDVDDSRFEIPAGYTES
jgi:hypothetical protein